MAAVAPQETRGRGRPRAGDPERISEIALELMYARGYGATTMADIAEAAGVSQATLFRYFPSKSAALWYGMDGTRQIVTDAFRAQPPERGTVDAILDAYLAMLRTTPVPLLILKRRTAVLTRDPDAGDAWLRYDEWSRLFASFVAERRGLEPGSLEATVLGGMIWAAFRAGLAAWATSDEEDPTRAVTAARRLVVIDE